MSLKPASLIFTVILVISALAQAQTRAGAKGAIKIKPNTTDCLATFNNALPSFCVTQNGNIENFEFPAGKSQIFTEGYGICDETTTVTSYFDDGRTDSGNWLPAVVTAGGGNNRLPLTITRTTSDGIWTLTQTFTRNTADEYVKVQITLKNNTAVARELFMTRYVDIDADGIASDNFFQGDSNSAFGFLSLNENFPNHGLMLHTLASPHSFFGYNVGSGDVDPCNFTPNDTVLSTNGDEAVMYTWSPNGSFSIGAKKSIKVVLEYSAM
ncbi:MAG TPA: hypothetical protein VNW47_16905 [Terriglobales bacterium]|nr:hypothetical protein [Terriglobales bacterium]